MSAALRQKKTVPPLKPQRTEYLAAVRYPDGRRDLFRILNAVDLADARELVMLEIGDARCVLIAPRQA